MEPGDAKPEIHEPLKHRVKLIPRRIRLLLLSIPGGILHGFGQGKQMLVCNSTHDLLISRKNINRLRFATQRQSGSYPPLAFQQ